MEDVLSVYAAPPDPTRPVVCFDELPYQILENSRPPLARKPGVSVRDDCEYVRWGTCNLFGCYAPQTGEQHIAVTAQRTARDFAEAMRLLVDTWFPEATMIRLVLDNLNTHTEAALYQAFGAAEARRIVARIEWHYTPKHGSWLNQMEIKWSVLTRQCLDRRIEDAQTLTCEVAAWEQECNTAKAQIDWRFTTDKARTKLARLYPS